MWKPRIARSLTGNDPKALHLSGSKCRICGREFFPPRNNCPHCMKEDTVESIQLSDRGKLQSYVICRIAPPGYETPHAQGYIDLNDNGPRIFSVITGYGDESNLKIGQEMELRVLNCGKDLDGYDILEYQFRPVRPGGGT